MVTGSRSLAWVQRLALVLGLLLLPASLGAAPTSGGGVGASKTKSKGKPTPEQKQAQEHAEAAAAAVRNGDAETAVRELKAARDLAPNADILLDLAHALVLKGDVLEAREVMKNLLARYGGELGLKRTKVEAELGRLQDRVATLRLTVSEAGASVSLDGRELGATPIATPIEANPGVHSLTVSKPGFVALARQENLAPGVTVLALDLVRERATGKLVVVASTTERLELSLNGKKAGTLPFEGDLEPGFYELGASNERVTSEPQTVRVERGQTTSVTLATKAIPGDLRVATGYPEAEIFLDDRLVGKGEWHASVAVGQHQLRVERPGYEPHRQALDLGAAERLVVDQIDYVPLARPKTDDGADYQGLFTDVSLLGFFAPQSTNAIARDCAANATGGDCGSTHPAGGGLGVRVGYSVGWAAFEGLVIGGIDVATADAKYAYGTPDDLTPYYGVPRSEHYAFFRYGYGLGIGARVTSRDPTFRVTGGIDGVLLRRTQQYVRATNANTPIPDANQTTSEAVSYFNPGFMTDIGILLGSTPGAKFHVGIAALVEFPPDPVTAAAVQTNVGRYPPDGVREAYGTPPLDLSRGPQVVAGPFLAVAFGH